MHQQETESPKGVPPSSSSSSSSFLSALRTRGSPSLRSGPIWGQKVGRLMSCQLPFAGGHAIHLPAANSLIDGCVCAVKGQMEMTRG